MMKLSTLPKFLSLSLFFSGFLLLLSAQELSTVRILRPEDIKIFRLDPSKDGFDLFVRKRDGVESIMLTDSTVDLQGLYDNFALRAYDPDPTYANEHRNLGDRTIALSDGSYFLVTSTAQVFKPLGDDEWFHLFVPSAVVFGYPRPGSREGQMEFIDDFWLNIRTFTAPNATYNTALPDRGFRDNPYHIRFQKVAPKTDSITPLSQLAKQTGGTFHTNLEKGEDFIATLEQIFAAIPATGTTKVVFAIDTTVSMKQVMPYVQREFLPTLIQELQQKPIQIGFVLYRDYEDARKGAYLTKILGTGFTRDAKVIEQHIKSITVGGGHDIPEAVYEAIERAVQDFDWSGAQNRIIIQIGDAPPHPTPKSRQIRTPEGKFITIFGPTQEQTIAMAKAKGITLITYLLPTNADYH
ncbi:VWA domain-containing protein [Entomospira culicis]|uniref:VWA domain-containing protein n=1 Tax=Entomospira culicis TaxID=2719989 RepID=A0A968GJV8_9SPIO|nr:VWA domain-containing protein [Entomospira culicis]NIZ19821.1 VWA domain-containing protein [Entomospira culicis]NIZ70035.1 VWA domain-containing protein [Entomospira culicis]WDI37141.1 VWA domain-containing protein [Entomospira culicis]WDI38770.1 VWA domain-containing protein [Entomospira culicis]